MKDIFVRPTSVDWSEGEAITSAQGGNAAAFEFLYKAHCRRVYSVCLRMMRNTAEAEDLTQQVFLRVFRKIGTFRRNSTFSTWLHRVTLNVVLMHLRRKKSAEILFEDFRRTGPDEVNEREHGCADASMFGAIDWINLMRAIGKLPRGCRREFLLYDVFGYEHKEIAQRLGCSVGCSKSQLHKARKRLRRLLQGEPGPAKASVCPT